MKTLILLITAILATASAAVNAASTNECPRILANLKVSVFAINQNANAYWQHRANFISLNFGQKQKTVSDPLMAAGQEKIYGNTLRAAMPDSLTNFGEQVTAALSKNCITPAKLSAIAEPIIKHAKRVKFDQFPEDEQSPVASTVNPETPKMPYN
jgi:hypothetical protein